MLGMLPRIGKPPRPGEKRLLERGVGWRTRPLPRPGNALEEQGLPSNAHPIPRGRDNAPRLPDAAWVRGPGRGAKLTNHLEAEAWTWG